MVRYESFKKYLEDNYIDVIMDRLSAFIVKKKDSFESDEIIYVSWVELQDAYVSGVTFKDLGNDELEIRSTIDAEVEVKGKSRYGYDSYEVTKCYNVFFKAVLADGLHNVTITEISEYDVNQYDRNKSLSQNLVPYMYEEDVEKHAEDFLRRHYPKALLQPMAIPVEEVVTSMGMKMYFAPLEDGVFGKTYFANDRVVVYDSILKREQYEVAIEPGTMLINPDVYFMRNIGTAHNTIIHECVHWDRHRRPFELQKLLSGNCSHISCEIVETYDGISVDDPSLKWMEWQANQLTPRILMPAEMTKKKLNECLHRLHAEFPRMRNAELLEKAIDELAMFFGVSFLAAKLRAIDLGFDTAQGTGVYVDGRYLPPFSFPKGTLKVNQTYVLDELNALQAIAFSTELRELYREGKIVYANSMVAWNLPKYVTENPYGVPILTEYALEHVNECCFVFTRKINASDSYSDTFYRRCFLCRDVNSETFVEATYDPEHKDNQDKAERKAELESISESINEMALKIANEIPGGFAGTLAYHMNRKNITNEELAARTNISTVSISGYKNSVEPTIDFARAVALCNGLKLHRIYALDMMRKAKHSLETFTPVNMMVDWLFTHHPDDTLEQWQIKLNESHTSLTLPGCKDLNEELEY